MKLVWATVHTVSDVGRDIQRLGVEIDDGSIGSAMAYQALCGDCAVGDRVLLNTTAVDLNLGTGGTHFVVARQGEGRGVALDRPSGGHIMKLRYSPLQVDVVSVEAAESPHHEAMREATTLAGMPVVCCGLHSQVPLVAAAAKDRVPEARIVYCMTDEASLALGLSELVRSSVAAGLIDHTITCGQAFGGHFEAVNLYSGLLAARHVAHADLAIVAIGPGVVGTATAYGHGGVAQGQAINAVAALSGRAVACLRVSFADTRQRHRAVSHHTLSALSGVALGAAVVAVPHLDAEKSDAISGALKDAGVWTVHERREPVRRRSAAPDMRGVRVTTMGREPGDDPAFFEAAFAAGDIASEIHMGVPEDSS